MLTIYAAAPTAARPAATQCNTIHQEYSWALGDVLMAKCMRVNRRSVRRENHFIQRTCASGAAVYATVSLSDGSMSLLHRTVGVVHVRVCNTNAGAWQVVYGTMKEWRLAAAAW